MTTLRRERRVRTVERIVRESQDLNLVMNRARTGNGPEVVVDGAPMRNFGSCGYMGLERDPRLLAGARAALDEFGTQFSFSRAYLESPLYAALEERLDRITSRHVLVAPSTTLAHVSALPVLVRDDDVVLIDQFAHASLHTATQLLDDTPVERLRHGRMDALEERLAHHCARAERVWYLCDGVYSMLGDFADFAALRTLLARYPNLHLYVDDAHAVSWCGTSGRGAALQWLGDCDRVVVALSLNKAFAAAGGALALPTGEMRTLIRRCGGPMLFSGPVQPPMLGAAVASADLHLDACFGAMQVELKTRIDLAHEAIARHGLRVATDARTPIFMVQFDAPGALHEAMHAMRSAGYYTCMSAFPAVPMDKPSMRFTVSRHNPLDEIERFVARLAEVVSARAPSRMA